MSGDGPHWYRLRGEVGGALRTFHLVAGINLVGSRSDNHVVLRVEGVSRRHAELVVAPDGVTVRDLESKNGVRIDGRRTTAGELAPGQRLRLGPLELELEELTAGDARLAIELPRPRPADEPASPSTPGATPFLPGARGGRPGGEPAGAGLVFPPGYVVCPSPAMAELYRQMRAVAASRLPVLLRGETGVGKELLAAAIHLSSPRAAEPLVTVNCAAIPAELLEAEMFGIGRGVATGVEAREGRFRLADGGTLFLDEVGDMPPPLQAKLLRALESGEVQPVGRAAVPVDVRVVAATNADLAARAAAGDFRVDLYYRLAGCVLEVPPLGRRSEDVPVLVEHFLRQSAAAEKSIRGMSWNALKRLTAHSWPGNVRELRHEVERLVRRCSDGGVIDSKLLSSAVVGEPAEHAAGPATDGELPDGSLHLARQVERLERRLIREALVRSGGRIAVAARLLGLSRNGLKAKARRLEIRL